MTPEQLAAAGTEHAHQCALMCWAADMAVAEPRLKLLFAIPNGGERNPVVAARLKAEGVKAGVPDLMLPVSCETQAQHHHPDRPATLVTTVVRWHGLFIEMKKPKDGKVSDKQGKWHADLTAQGYKVVTCWGWEEARDTLLWYLGINKD